MFFLKEEEGMSSANPSTYSSCVENMISAKVQQVYLNLTEYVKVLFLKHVS